MAFTYFSDFKARLQRPGGPPFYFRVTNLIVAVLMIISAIVFFTWSDFGRIMVGVYKIIFGLWMIMSELAELAWLTPYVQFMYTWRGRGIFYVFIGCLTLGHKTFGWVFGAVIAGIGVVYIVLSFTAMRHESYAADAMGGGSYPAASDNMYNTNPVYMQKNETYGSVLSVQHGAAQPYYTGQQQPQPQPQFTTTQYASSNYHPDQPDRDQYPPTQYSHNPTEPNTQYSRTDHLHSPI
ncbi:hypothetical protein IWW50_002415 [Coemansia erecta]|nr:hypothetical protein GGF43_004443 [Coemansia sp. RSA 2618]KAJ2826318.1 hypothetical protein IWW50_002415 [Coemansia erecta]